MCPKKVISYADWAMIDDTEYKCRMSNSELTANVITSPTITGFASKGEDIYIVAYA